MGQRLAWLLAAALAFAGCTDRRAGTEVGNPEITVTARSAVFDQDDSLEVSSFPLMMMGMDYLLSGKASALDSGTCWKRPGGILMDFASESQPLRDTSIEDGDWSRTEIVLRAPEGTAFLNPADIRTLDNPRYVKFNFIRRSLGDTLPMLFEWPLGMEIRLVYGQESIDIWRWGEEIWVPFQFFAFDWADIIQASDRNWNYRKDGRNKRFVLFSAAENAATWAELKAKLPDCFGADSVLIR